MKPHHAIREKCLASAITDDPLQRRSSLCPTNGVVSVTGFLRPEATFPRHDFFAAMARSICGMRLRSCPAIIRVMCSMVPSHCPSLKLI